MEDVMANGLRSATVVSSAKIARSHDRQIPVSVGIVIIGILVALLAIASTPPIDLSQIGDMSIFP
jgi:hypothetical protein